MNLQPTIKLTMMSTTESVEAVTFTLNNIKDVDKKVIEQHRNNLELDKFEVHVGETKVGSVEYDIHAEAWPKFYKPILAKTPEERAAILEEAKTKVQIIHSSKVSQKDEGRLTKIRNAVKGIVEKSVAFFKVMEVKFPRKTRTPEQGVWVTRTENVMGPRKAGQVLVSINVFEEIKDPTTGKVIIKEREQRTWVTETDHGLETVWQDPEAEPEGEIGDYKGTLTPRLKLLKAAAVAWNNEDFILYNAIVINLGIRGAKRNYFFEGRKEETANDFNVDYYRGRFGERDRFSNYAARLARRFMDMLYPSMKGKKATTAVPASVWLHNADWDRDDRPKKDSDMGEEHAEADVENLSEAEEYRRQLTMSTNSAGFAFITKDKGEQPRTECPEGHIEVAAMWHLPLVDLDAEVVANTAEYRQLLEDKKMFFRSEYDQKLHVYPVMIMGGSAVYVEQAVWDMLQPFRSQSMEHDQEQDYFTHENGEEKFADNETAIREFKREIYEGSITKADEIRQELVQKTKADICEIGSVSGLEWKSKTKKADMIDEIVEYILS